MSEKVILAETDARGVASVTLNRPDVFNGYNAEMLGELRQIAESLDQDDNVRIVVLRAAGKHFSAGADVNWFRELADATEEEQLAAAKLSAYAMRALYALGKPTIALVHNACFGGGTGYAAACDIVVASDDARFSISEVRLGLTPAPILPELVAAIGPRHLRRYALSGETFDVSEAQRIGLVHEICPVGGLDDAAEPIIDALLRGAPRAVRETKKLIAQVADMEIADVTAENMAAIGARGRSLDEAVEGFTAFFAKRAANWYPGD
ncbi:MAG: enoyl-CoA hydratase-related protein [Rhodospirillales bacterium]|jgi:methylglutaconyl-CoA hydratase|nr:enoyl-CoA hydratase [Rhodospirillaceae bacterium]MDP6430381.1 enoyl-CoA hydratase-related protein [Rhodospirillales bacterium]MDP6646681.1 enoyl-CoA hydratase-related protein [Rhodospirillales bacterium]MDP6841779.1 enoyl-CoA hydratase-related protein [Rhodospirillales bacterium]|tara:strand:- start:1208 stop:2002 length:795 start_codon:yes stop_codon:yes gene_type:complete